MWVNKTSLLELTGTDRQEGVVICVGRRLLYVLGGGCYMCWEEVVIWAERGLLYADKPKYRKACAFKNMFYNFFPNLSDWFDLKDTLDWISEKSISLYDKNNWTPELQKENFCPDRRQFRICFFASRCFKILFLAHTIHCTMSQIKGLRWTQKVRQCTNWKENLRICELAKASNRKNWSIQLVRSAGLFKWSVQLVCPAGPSSWSD